MSSNLISFGTRFPRSLNLFGREVDDLFEHFFSPIRGGDEVAAFAPRTNLAETESEYDVTVDLPGMNAEEFNVELNDNELWITGERKHESEESGKTYHRVERHYGTFRRAFSLPGDVDGENVDAQYKDGVLRVKVPKAEATKPKKINVKS